MPTLTESFPSLAAELSRQLRLAGRAPLADQIDTAAIARVTFDDSGRKVSGAKLKDLMRLAGLKEYATVAMAIKRFASRLADQKHVPAESRRVNQLLNVKM